MLAVATSESSGAAALVQAGLRHFTPATVLKNIRDKPS